MLLAVSFLCTICFTNNIRQASESIHLLNLCAGHSFQYTAIWHYINIPWDACLTFWACLVGVSFSKFSNVPTLTVWKFCMSIYITSPTICMRAVVTLELELELDDELYRMCMHVTCMHVLWGILVWILFRSAVSASPKRSRSHKLVLNSEWWPFIMYTEIVGCEYQFLLLLPFSWDSNGPTATACMCKAQAFAVWKESIKRLTMSHSAVSVFTCFADLASNNRKAMSIIHKHVWIQVWAHCDANFHYAQVEFGLWILIQAVEITYFCLAWPAQVKYTCIHKHCLHHPHLKLVTERVESTHIRISL